MSKVMVSIADELLAQIDAEAARRSTSRSALLALAAQRELARRDNDLVAAAGRSGVHRFEATVASGCTGTVQIFSHYNPESTPIRGTDLAVLRSYSAAAPAAVTNRFLEADP